MAPTDGFEEKVASAQADLCEALKAKLNGGPIPRPEFHECACGWRWTPMHMLGYGVAHETFKVWNPDGVCGPVREE